MFSISADWEASADGTPEEQACFASIAIRAGELCLSEGHDPFVRRIREAPYLSAYHLAEWLVWNWWRLRWEPRSRKSDWPFAHRLATGGSGYVWPNLTFFSDCHRVAIIAEPSRARDDAGFRYLADAAVVLPAADFENAVESFVSQVAGQLEAEGLAGSNLDRLRADLAAERSDGSLSQLRRIEALMGCDPDEAPRPEVDRLLADQAELGPSAITELAAESSGRATVIGARELFAVADRQGFDMATEDAFRLDHRDGHAWSQTPAWLTGRRLAREARIELGIGEAAVSDAGLSSLVAAAPLIFSEEGIAPLSFALRKAVNRERIVLRSRWRTGRRFELARILGDRLAVPEGEQLRPATRSQTYRQKMQRAFAAEFLSPFEAVEDMMGGDYSEDQQQDVAEHFAVSPLVIRTLLANHRRIGRDSLDAEVDLPEQTLAA